MLFQLAGYHLKDDKFEQIVQSIAQAFWPESAYLEQCDTIPAWPHKPAAEVALRK